MSPPPPPLPFLHAPSRTHRPVPLQARSPPPPVHSVFSSASSPPPLWFPFIHSPLMAALRSCGGVSGGEPIWQRHEDYAAVARGLHWRWWAGNNSLAPARATSAAARGVPRQWATAARLTLPPGTLLSPPPLLFLSFAPHPATSRRQRPVVPPQCLLLVVCPFPATCRSPILPGWPPLLLSMASRRGCEAACREEGVTGRSSGRGSRR